MIDYDAYLWKPVPTMSALAKKVMQNERERQKVRGSRLAMFVAKNERFRFEEKMKSRSSSELEGNAAWKALA